MEIKQQNQTETLARIKVVGVGGGGCNAVNRMLTEGFPGIEFVAINTDMASLNQSKSKIRVSIGDKLTRGLGTGGDPEIGRKAAEESPDEIYEVLKGSDMVFVAAGMGGGTGTGASPVIAQIAREMGALTIGVVTRPFIFEGSKRMQTAEVGIAKLKDQVDTLIVIPNDRLLQVSRQDQALKDALKDGDDPLKQGIQCISELVTSSGLIHRDFADVKTVMQMGGAAFFAVGKASGEDRAKLAAEMATKNELLDITIEGARGILMNITGSDDMTLHEANQAAAILRENAHPDVNFLFGVAIDPQLNDEVRITVIATGFEQTSMRSSIRRITQHAEEIINGEMGKNDAELTAIPRSVVDTLKEVPIDVDDVKAPAFLRRKNQSN